MTIIKNNYYDIVCEDIILKQNITNIHQIARPLKITLSNSSQVVTKNAQYAILSGKKGLELICGQKPKITKAKKSISAFQLRANQTIGCKVTLRKHRMFCFFDKFVFIMLPHCQKMGLNMGVVKISLFPEVERCYYDYFDFFKGVSVYIHLSKSKTKRLFLSGLIS